MDAVYCVQCRKPIEIPDVFCKQCGADQRPPNQRPILVPVTHSLPPNIPPPSGYNASAGAAISNPVPAQEEVSWVWTLIGGSIYFFIKGWWKAGLISFVIAIFTGGLSWLVIPFFAQSFVRNIEGQNGTLNIGVSAKPLDNLAALQQLADLRSKGIITEAEYEAKRGDLLNRV